MLPWCLQVLYRPVPISNTKQEGRGKGKQARATRDQPQQQQSNAPEAVDAPPAKPVKLLRKANSTNAQQENGISSAPRLQAEAASQVGCTSCRMISSAPKLQAKAASQVGFSSCRVAHVGEDDSSAPQQSSASSAARVQTCQVGSMCVMLAASNSCGGWHGSWQHTVLVVPSVLCRWAACNA